MKSKYKINFLVSERYKNEWDSKVLQENGFSH